MGGLLWWTVVPVPRLGESRSCPLACGSPGLPVEDKFHSCHSPAAKCLLCFGFQLFIWLTVAILAPEYEPWG